MTVLPRPTKETYTDFLKRKLRGRNVSPEFRQRYPALFDSVQQTTPAPVANWETYYRQAKPKTNIQNNDDGMGNTDGLFNPNDLSREYLDSFIANVQNAPQNIARSFERGFNELTTGLPDVRSNESILAEIDANREARDRAGLMGHPSLFDMTDTLMKGEFDNLEKWGWGPDNLVKGEDYVDTLERGLFSGLGPFGEKLGGAIQEEVLNPVVEGVKDFKKEANELWDKGPVEYVEKVVGNLNTSTLVPKGAGMLGKYGAGLLGLGTIPATIAGYGIGKIAEMMMSEGGGQIGMPGIIADDYWNPGGTTLGPSTVSSIHGYAQTPDGIRAVDIRGNILAEHNPNDPTRHGLLLGGWSPTEAGQIAYDERDGGGYVDSPVKGQGGNLFDASTHSLDKGFGYDPDDDGHGGGYEETDSGEMDEDT
tara:strand:- start:1200 stop:2465 length:1266 start_codon:yes stop_codon:yes gene_type:complete